jgi:hypothetical protein
MLKICACFMCLCNNKYSDCIITRVTLRKYKLLMILHYLNLQTCIKIRKNWKGYYQYLIKLKGLLQRS